VTGPDHARTVDEGADRLARQLAFLLEADRLKQVERQTDVIGGGRRENTAEHSWHLGLFALVLAEHADDAVNLARVLAMVLVHDLVEIDAGDTFAYDEAGYETKAAREQAAADRLFGLLPQGQAEELRALWEEHEAGVTVDARFANALDRLQPVLLNHAAGTDAPWVRHGITYEQIVRRNAVIADGSKALWAEAHERITEAVTKGWVVAERPPEQPERPEGG
jgi:putative hydrolase of HD superfamily